MRTFIAINLSDEIKHKISEAITSLSRLASKERFIKPENLHLTLKFLGEIEIKKAEDLYASLSNVLKDFRAFKIAIKGMGVFPNMKAPRIVWVGVDKTKELEQLYHHIETVCEMFGFKKENRLFSPHITITRLKGNVSDEFKTVIQKNPDTTYGMLDVRSVEIMQSILSSQGAEYKIFRTISLVT
ncbi:MAG: RNA 2',3'-cyclic phosphodiesterase [Thermodesulfovibrionales bacterium]|nr:RNA 2',3'-cyclic phosphodiesterase [Thermodesulfovibrionales bacterium]